MTAFREQAVNLLGEDTKYIQVPFADLDDLDEEGHFERRQSSFWFSRVVATGVCCAVIGAVIVVVIYYYEHQPHHTDDDAIIPPPVIQTCYESPACPPVLQSYNPITGITNMTGWQSDGVDACCNICPVSTVTPTPTIKYDYLLLDQIWLPQFCYALQSGHDPTLSHLAHQYCVPSVLQSTPRLTIHGLWPNQYVGYSVCCAWGGKSVPVLDVTTVSTWPIYDSLNTEWFDPTVNTTIPYAPDPSNPTTSQCLSCNLCYLLNHEWQKHGSCYGLIEENHDVNRNALQYFTDGLEIHHLLQSPTQSIQTYHNSIVATKTLADLYAPFRVNIMCDPQDTSFVNVNDAVGVFLEVQTCWLPKRLTGNIAETRKNTGFDNLNFTMIDCPDNVQSSQFSAVCPEFVFLRNFLPLPTVVV